MSSKNENEVAATGLLGALATGGVVSTKLHEDKITIDGVEVPVHIAEIPDGAFRSAFKAKEGYDRLQLILEAVRNPDGSYAFKDAAGQLRKITLDDGTRAAALHKIKVGVAKQLEELAMKYNGFSEDTSEAEAEGND